MPFSPSLRRFVRDRITSVGLLEVLLLLRASPERQWSDEEVGRALSTYTEVAALRLAELVAGGLVQRCGEDDGRFCYAPQRPGDRELVDELTAAFAKRRVAVIEMIFGAPRAAARNFSDAFRLREDTDDG
jgi:hypothetical protein